MSTVVLDSFKLEAAAQSVGINGRSALIQHLGLDYMQPVTLLMVATILTRLPIHAGAVFHFAESGQSAA